MVHALALAAAAAFVAEPPPPPPAPVPGVPAACRPAGQPTVAVLEFKTAGLKAEAKPFLSEALRGAFIDTRCYKTQDATEMRAILHTQAVNLTAACSESSCEVEVGRLLQVRYIVLPQAFLEKDGVHLLAHLTDVEEGTAIETAELTVPNTPDELTKGVRRLAREISGVDPRERGPYAYLALGGAALAGGVAGVLGYATIGSMKDLGNASDAAGWNAAHARASNEALGATVSWIAAGALALGGVSLLAFTNL